MNCPVCDQSVPTIKIDNSLYLQNHVEVLQFTAHWTEESAPLKVRTRMCEGSGLPVDQQT